MTVQFRVQDLQHQILDMAKLSKKFLSPDSLYRLEECSHDLGSIVRAGRTDRWQISRDRPLKTRVSNGCYEPGGRGALCLEAVISFVWEVRPLDNGFVGLDGIASTRVEFYGLDPRATPHSLVWRHEVGDSQSPGTYFHTQISGSSDFVVPRFPGMILTPVDAIDFVLGEMFQDEWPREQRYNDSTIKRFAPKQRKRLKTTLQEQSRAVDERSELSGWMSLKGWIPEGLALT